MTNLLQSEYLLRHFQCDGHGHFDREGWKGCCAINIIDGMCAPIKFGESYYDMSLETIKVADFADTDYFHPYAIRLPNWHQKPKHTHKYVCECGEVKI